MSFEKELESTARDLVSPGRGILAADESPPTIKKRFDGIGVESLEETRRSYRDLLFSTAGAEEFISGVILFDETLRQSTHDSTPFPTLLSSKDITPGIKVDKGAKPLAGAAGAATATLTGAGLGGAGFAGAGLAGAASPRCEKTRGTWWQGRSRPACRSHPAAGWWCSRWMGDGM